MIYDFDKYYRLWYFKTYVCFTLDIMDLASATLRLSENKYN